MIGTILLLGITVTLFGAVFFFVNAFPRPPAQANSQFSAALTYGGTGGTQVTAVSITHLAGPTLYSTQTQVYLASQAHPTAFAGKNPYTLGSGLAGATAWGVGQVWSVSVSSLVPMLTTPDNITISIVSGGQLLFRNVLPGSNPNIPPQFVNQGTTPATPGVGQSLTIFAQIVDDDLNNRSVYVNVTQIPGASAVCSKACLMTYNAASGTYQYTVAAGVTTTAGTFFVFVNATDIAKQPNSVVIPVTIGIGGASAAGPIQDQLALNQSAPVSGANVSLIATVTDTSSTGGSLATTFQANGATIATVNSSVGPGSTVTVSQTWKPSAVGSVLLSVVANVSGVGSSTANLNTTVFPKILFLAHNVPTGTNGASNASAQFAGELTAAGIPFISAFSSCKAGVPSTGSFGSLTQYKVVIVDFGSNSSASAGCRTAPTSTDQTNITGATGVNYWMVGANAWVGLSASCPTTYLAVFGITISGSNCVGTLTAPVTPVTYSAPSACTGLRADGISGSISSYTIPKTLSGASLYNQSAYFKAGATNPYLLSGANAVGSCIIGTNGAGSREAALGTDPALLSVPLPNGTAAGTGAGGTALVYNVVDWLAGISSASASGRAQTDYSVAQASLSGTVHTSVSKVYVALRANGAAGGAVTVALYVNGTPALYQGSPVTATAYVTGSGGWTYVTLSWQAPGGGGYTLSVSLISASGDTNPTNNQRPLALLATPTQFT